MKINISRKKINHHSKFTFDFLFIHILKSVKSMDQHNYHPCVLPDETGFKIDYAEIPVVNKLIWSVKVLNDDLKDLWRCQYYRTDESNYNPKLWRTNMHLKQIIPMMSLPKKGDKLYKFVLMFFDLDDQKCIKPIYPPQEFLQKYEDRFEDPSLLDVYKPRGNG